MNALFVTARYKSLGETYSLARFAQGLRRHGWGVHFLAFDFAAGFLQQQGLPVTLLLDDLERNRQAFRRSVAAQRPQLIVTADYFLLGFKEMADVWSSRWLFDAGCPVASFDHLMFHPARRTLYLAFHKRLESLTLGMLSARVRATTARSAVKVERRKVRSTSCEIDELPHEVVALIRSCPVHDPRPEADARMFRFSAAAGEDPGPAGREVVRAGLGLADRERLVLVLVSSWALQVCRDFHIPYYDHYPRLLVRYLSGFPGAVRLLFLSGELGARQETHGRLRVEFRSALPFDRVREVTAAADLVLTDNVTSASLGRAVMYGVPAAAVVSSVETRRTGSGVSLSAPFPLSAFARDLLTDMETRAPGSVFPFEVFPMGWREELQPLFRDNLYASAFERLELFDEERTRAQLERLLAGGDHVAALQARQAAYRRAVEQLPGAAAIAEQILARTRVEAHA